VGRWGPKNKTSSLLHPQMDGKVEKLRCHADMSAGMLTATKPGLPLRVSSVVSYQDMDLRKPVYSRTSSFRDGTIPTVLSDYSASLSHFDA
jgi:hypothetical protein